MWQMLDKKVASLEPMRATMVFRGIAHKFPDLKSIHANGMNLKGARSHILSKKVKIEGERQGWSADYTLWLSKEHMEPYSVEVPVVAGSIEAIERLGVALLLFAGRFFKMLSTVLAMAVALVSVKATHEHDSSLILVGFFVLSVIALLGGTGNGF